MVKRDSGFSLLELLMVVMILSVIAVIAVPGLRRARLRAEEGSAIQSLRTLATAEFMHHAKVKRYADLATLAASDEIDSVLGSGDKQGFTFLVTLADSDQKFSVTATPKSNPGTQQHYFVDESSVIRYAVGAPAHAGSDPIPE